MELDSSNLDEVELNLSESESFYRFYSETGTFTLLFLLGIITNAPLLLTYFRSKHIRSAVDKFLFNMIIADALCVMILVPTILSDLLLPEDSKDLINDATVSSTGESISESFMKIGVASTSIPLPFSIRNVDVVQQSVLLLTTPPEFSRPSWTCSFKKSLLSGVSTASILASLEIAVERYLAVVNPLHYHEFLTKTGVVSTSSIGSLIAIGSAILSSLDPCQPVFPGCVKNTSSLTDSIWWPSYTLAHVSLFFIFPILFMTFIYVKIWWEAKRQRAKMSSQYQRPFFVNVPNYGNTEHPITVEHAVEESRRGKRFYLHPILLRFKLIERLVAPRMDRAARVAICTLFVTILCWGPYYFVETSHALQSIVMEPSRTKAWYHIETILPLFFASLHPIIAPFFYAYRYKRVREEAAKVCCFDVCGHKTTCTGLIPRRSIVLDFHDTHLNSSASKTTHILTPVSSELALHTNLNNPGHYYSPPSSPKPPKFHIGPDTDMDVEITGCSSGLGSCDTSLHNNSLLVPNNGLKVSQLSLNQSKIIPTRPLTATSLVHCFSVWWTSYSSRWTSHRESVTSTSSIATLLNNSTTKNNNTISITHDPPISFV